MAKVEISIDLPGIEIQKVEEDKRGNVLITVKTTEESLPCRKCGKALTKRHGNGEERRLRHLPAFGKPQLCRTKCLEHEQYMQISGFNL